MSTATRRDFLGLAAAAAIGFPAGQSVADESVSGKLIGVGFGAKRFSTQPASGSSVVTELNLATGTVRNGFLPMAAAHTLLATLPGLSLCLPLDGAEALWVDSQLAPAGRLLAPNGFFFSGHGVMMPARALAFVTLRQKEARSKADTGRIGVIDVRKKQLIGVFDSGGVRPHDIAVSDHTLLVSHYGDIQGQKREPCLVGLDGDTGRVLQVIRTTTEGTLTHFAQGARGQVCAVPLNYYGYDEVGRRAVEQSVKGHFEISVAEELEGRIAVPMPLLLLDRQAGTVQEISGEPLKQRRAQSVTYHPAVDRFFVTYSFSDTLACVEGKSVRYVSSFDLGLSFLRGVCPIGKTNLLAVTGEFRGVALIDAQSLAVVKRMDVAWFDNPHVSYSPV